MSLLSLIPVALLLIVAGAALVLGTRGGAR